MISRLEKAAKSRVADIRRDEVMSNSIHAILSTMTAGRIQLFYAIADKKPESIYHLAQILDRDPANVIRDVKTLEGLDLVRLLSERDGKRERLRPVALYDRLVFDFGEAGVLSTETRKKTAAS